MSLESSNGDALQLKNDGKLTFKNSSGQEVSLQGGSSTLDVYGTLSVRTQDVDGYKVKSGLVTAAGSDGSIDWKEAVDFSNFISGQLILTTQDQGNQYAPSAVYNLHWGANSNKLETFNQSNGWSGSYWQSFSARFDNTNRKLEIGANHSAAMPDTTDVNSRSLEES